MATKQIKIGLPNEKTRFSFPQITFAIISEILKCLPAKSLMRFKCVCKAWLDLIRNPSFAKSHFSYSRTRPKASCILYLNKNEIFATDEKLVPRNSQIPNIRFDMSYFSSVVNGIISSNNSDNTVMHNITTGEMRFLPMIRLIGDSNLFALGFDPISNKYKVLHLLFDNHKKKVQAEILILAFGRKNASWIMLPEPTLPRTSWTTKPADSTMWGTLGPVYFDGKIYFNGQDNFKNSSIQFFDLTSEKFGTIAPPKSFEAPNSDHNNHHNFLYSIVELGGGNLGFVTNHRTRDHKFETKIWVLDKKESNWLEECILNFSISRVDFGVSESLLGGGIGMGNEILLFHHGTNPRLFLYDTTRATIVQRFCGFKYLFPISCYHVENIIPFNLKH